MLTLVIGLGSIFMPPVVMADEGGQRIESASASPVFRWPGGRRAAVSLAYDDALDTQLDVAAPALDRHGFKASFYLTVANPAMRERLEEWRALAVSGHELGNHSLFHACSGSGSGRGWVLAHRDLDRQPVARVQDEVRLANTVLMALDGRRDRTFTVPCGDREAADGDYVEGLRGDFTAIKVMGGGVVADMAALDLHAVPVAAPVGTSGEALIAIVEEAAARGTMANLTFHGIGGDHLAVSREAHDALLAHLAAHPDIYWVETFIAIAGHVRAQREGVAATAPSP